MSLLQDLISEDFGIEGRGKWFHSQQHDSLVYNAEEDFFFWNSQDIKGGALDYLIHVRGLEKNAASNFLNNYHGAFRETQETKARSKPYDKLVELMWKGGKNNRDYWYERCLTDDTIDRRQLGYYDGWNLIPIYRNREFVNFQKRREIPSKSMHYWYKTGEVYLYNEDILPFIDVVYITEGIVDSILLNQEGFPSVSATGVNTWQNEWFSKFSKVKNIYYFEDNDKAGRIGAKLVVNSLGMYRVKIVSFPDRAEKYDTGDFFKDGGTKESLTEYISNNSKYLFELEVVYGKKQDIGRQRTGGKIFARNN